MAEVPVVAPEEAIRFFRRKGIAFGFAWQDVWQEDHARAFTVAKAMNRDVLEDIRAAVDKAIADGETLDHFREQLRPRLEARGWWGRKPMTDPLTGEQKVVQLGSPRRLKTIFEVNMRSAYAAGRWERMQRTKSAFPYVRYMTAGDARVRPQHQAWGGVIRPIDDPFWDTHYPPCGWNCRCTAQPVNDRMMEKRGWTVTDKPPQFLPEPYVNPRTGEVSKIEAGISPGFNFNVGKAYLRNFAPTPMGPAASGVEAAARPGLAAELRHLSDEALAALTSYKRSELGEINAHLRHGRAADAATLAEIEHIDRALAGAALKEPATVFRGMHSGTLHAAARADPASLVGRVVEDKGFMSATTSFDTAGSFSSNASPTRQDGVVFEIAAPKGARALPIDSLGDTAKGSDRESELLFDRNGRIRIIGVRPGLWRGSVVLIGELL